MEPDFAARARSRAGLVLADDLGAHPGRRAARAGLRRLHPGAYVARTQPLDPTVHLAAVRELWAGREVYVLGAAALWLHGAPVDRPATVELGVPASTALVVGHPVEVRRLAKSVLNGSRHRHGCLLVALEIAVIQVAVSSSDAEARSLIEDLVRSRRTTLAKLRSRCRRGIAGSARVRRMCDELSGGSMDADVRRLRNALLAAGLAPLEAEVRFLNRAGGSAYADLLHRPTMTVFEVDGHLSHSTREQFRTDRRRDRWMRREHGVTTLRIDVSEIRQDLPRLVHELMDLIATAELREL